MKKVLLLSSLLIACTAFGDVQKEKLDTDAKQVGYIVGQNYGFNLKQQSVEFDIDAFIEGFKEGLKGMTNIFSEEEMNEIMMKFQSDLRAKQELKRKELGEKNEKIGKEFLAANREKEGVKETKSGLQYKVEKEGEGECPSADDTVTVNYRGTTIDGTEFDSSYKRNQPATFPLKNVIKGWTEGLQLMKPGAKYTFYIPGELAYGSTGNRNIEPNSVLIFDVELISVKKAVAAKEEKPAVTSDIIKVPSASEMKKGAKPEVIKK